MLLEVSLQESMEESMVPPTFPGILSSPPLCGYQDPAPAGTYFAQHVAAEAKTSMSYTF